MNSVQRCAGRVEGGDDFAWAVARGAYQLMAYKDEYEVARLYTDGRFQSALSKEFESYDSVKFHLAPPLLGSRKIAFGSWILPVFRVLSRLRTLREGPFDIFGRSTERRLERKLRDTYLDVIARLTNTLSAETLTHATKVAASPAAVRGYGHIKQPRAGALLDELSAELAGARR